MPRGVKPGYVPKWTVEYKREYQRAYQLQRRYGLSKEDAQEWAHRTTTDPCMICGALPSAEKRTDSPFSNSRYHHVDHCHESGEVRGVLCHHCNVGLGAFRDDPILMARASGYLSYNHTNPLPVDTLLGV